MSFAKLRSVEIERFKSFKEATRVTFAPLTIVLGRNNCGKSTLIQSLLLLKQTLADPRPEVMLKLEGLLEAINLRELTFGWPPSGSEVEGPVLQLQWESEVDVANAFAQAGNPEIKNFIRHSRVTWIKDPPLEKKILHTAIKLWTTERSGTAGISRIALSSGESAGAMDNVVEFTRTENRWQCLWRGEPTDTLGVELEHFIPYLQIDRSTLGPRVKERAWYNAYLLLFAQPLEDLKQLLSEMHYLGSSRQVPPSLYRPATAAPNELGVSGEFAAQLLHRRQNDFVHFLPSLRIQKSPEIPKLVRAATMVTAVNEVLSDLGVNARIRVQEIQEVGFRLMFGEASMAHVGRGLNSLLPLIEVGLFADPLRFKEPLYEVPLEEYRQACKSFTQIALEEPEAHLHPKVASHFAHWLVSLALSNRHLIVETHSDHLVRRLRGLAVRAGKGSELEQWLVSNVAIVSVEQDATGRSSTQTSYLTTEGGMAEKWPADFMDEATDEESAIYYAKLDKAEPARGGTIKFDDSKEPEPEVAP